jgi:DNA-binding SARP family transcriptional activator
MVANEAPVRSARADGPSARVPLQVRLLGELQLIGRNGQPLPLPASKKTRALIGYLVATSQPHRRERLCDLLWEGPNDPRAELRWSLNKIRPLLNEAGLSRLAVDRERVHFQTVEATVDLERLHALLSDAKAPVEQLKEAVGLFRGEFLDGLDLPACYRYQEWCLAEREAISGLRLAALRAIVDRSEAPEEALRYARTLIAIDPLSESGHAAVVRLLGGLGRKKEAIAHYQHARGLLEKELETPWFEELENARLALKSSPREPGESKAARSANVLPRARDDRPPQRRLPLVGRHAERGIIDDLVSAGIAGEPLPVLLVTGEAGIGKSRLLEYVRQRIQAMPGRAFEARAFEAEATRSYGIWTDLLARVARERDRDDLQRVDPLLPENEPAPGNVVGRSRLFDGVVDLLGSLAGGQPTVITLDDIQWIDEASASLLSYAIRKLDGSARLIVACAVRAAEVADNTTIAAVLQALKREGRLRELMLGPLGEDETMELVRAIDPSLDAKLLFARSEGNPLFVIELAHARMRGIDDEQGTTLRSVIAGQLRQLSDRSRDVLMWAAVIGKSFTTDLVGRVAGCGAAELLSSLEELERRGIIMPVGDDTYDFVHDLVRETAYAGMSQPRRRLCHRHVTRFLTDIATGDGRYAAELAHHAALCDDAATAAQACAAAGERALRLFANADAAAFAERGLRFLRRVPYVAAGLETYIALLRVRVMAAMGPGMHPLPPLREEINAVISQAEALGLAASAATGHYLLSLLHQESGDTRRAQEDTLRAAEAGRSADTAIQAQQFANTARCLLELEAEVQRARGLIHEAGALSEPLRLENCEMHWARGLLYRWDGHEKEAAREVQRALALARSREDRWREYKCLTWLAMIELELGEYATVLRHCAELRSMASKLGEGEGPFAATLEGLAKLALNEPGARDILTRALQQLRAIDDKSYLAYALNLAAEFHLRDGRKEAARICAAEALSVAGIVHRKNEQVIAQALLARCTRTSQGTPRARAVDDLPGQELCSQDRISARARNALLKSPLSRVTRTGAPDKPSSLMP